MGGEKSSDAWIISFVDLFINAIGCVLMLMVLGLRNTHPGSGKKGAPDAFPVMLTVAWQADPPAALRVRLRREEQGVFREVPPERYRNLDLAGRGTAGSGSAADGRQGGRLLVFDAEPGAAFQVQGSVGVESPLKLKEQPTDPYELLVLEVLAAWETFARSPAQRAAAIDAIRKKTRPYLQLHEALAELRRTWLSREERWRKTPADPASRFADMTGERLNLAGALLDKALQERWDFPRRAFFEPSRGPGPGAEPNVVGFEPALTRLLLEQADPREQDWRRRWIAGQARLLEPSFALPLTFTLAAPGAKELLEQPHHLRNPFAAAPDSFPWRNLAEVRADARGRVTVKWDEDSVPDPVAPPAERPATSPPVKPAPVESHWETVYRKYEGDPDHAMLERIDRALAFLAERHKQGKDGAFPAVEGREHPDDGPAITGLCLMAFAGGGHLAAQKGSPYRALTRAAVENLIRTLPGVSDGKRKHPYHHGFATMALAQAYPALQRNDPALAAASRATLDQSVEAMLNLQGPKGSWGYDPERDDSSVTSVLVKALSDARPFVDAQRQAKIDEALSGAAAFFERCYRPDGHYVYREIRSEGAGFLDGIFRQGGCMLGQYLGALRGQPSGAAPYPAKALERLLEWRPDPKTVGRSSYAHYGLFYAAHAMLYAEPRKAEPWFRWSRDLLRQVGVGPRGDFGGQTYGTAMAVIVLTLPARHELESLGRR